MLTAFGLGTAMTLITGLTTMINYAIYYSLLVPLHMEYMTFLAFIAVIAAFVQFTEMFIERFSSKLYYSLGIFLPLMVVNCTIMGAALFMVFRHYTFVQTTGWGFGAGAGWMMAAVMMAGLRQKMGYSNPPVAFRGAALVMIVAGLMAMTFMGFAGMVAIE